MTDQIKFVGLHAHSVFSIFDGLGYPQDHIDFAVENGMDALALTDHGNMNGLSYQVLHAKKLNKEGKKFKPIFGIEAYFIDSLDKWKQEYTEFQKNKKEKVEENSAVVVEDEETTKREEKSLINRRAHLVLLAQNQTGLNNLFTLVSKSYDPNNFYRYPRIDYKMLREHNEGIIVSSACMGGPLSKDYWNNKDKGDVAIQEAMAKTIKEFTSIFGDRFYAELQWNAVPEQHKINQHIIKAAKEAGVQLVSTADSHYARPELFKDRELYKQLGWLGSKGEDEELKLPQTREDLKYELYPKNGNQMWEAYQKYSKAQGFTYDDALVKQSGFLNSNGEARRELKANAISVNKEKVDEHFIINETHLLNNRFVLLGKGKKSNFILTCL